MGVADLTSAVRSSCPRGHELLEAGCGTDPRTAQRRSGSKFSGFPRFELRQSFRDKPIKFSGLQISLNLPIPHLRVKLKEPSAKFGEIFRRKLFNPFFELFYFAHCLRPRFLAHFDCTPTRGASGFSNNRLAPNTSMPTTGCKIQRDIVRKPYNTTLVLPFQQSNVEGVCLSVVSNLH